MARLLATFGFAARLWLLCALSLASVSCPEFPVMGEIEFDMQNATDRVVRVTVPEVLQSQDIQTSVARPVTATPYTQEWRLLVDETLQPGEAKKVTLKVRAGDYVGPARAYSNGELVFCEQFTGHSVHSNGRQRWNLVVRQGPLECEPRGPWNR